ncbi:MAG: cardiolipin synthase [Lachnospiraceae bacterium]|nr:cardiolipin synthase [Candidatus Equihabitans merdae]
MSDNELRLIEKPKKGLLRLVFSRTGVVLLLLLISMAILFSVFYFFAGWLRHFAGGVEIFNLIVIIYLINTDMDSTAKVTWILIVAVTSVFGAIFYVYTKSDLVNRRVKKTYMQIFRDRKGEITQDQETLKRLKEESPESAALLHYLNQNEAVIAATNSEITYYPLGELKWEAMLEELEKAEKFIFMEYFIIDEGKMWGRILNILKEKVEQGVEVRVMYDGTCAMSTLPYNYPKMMEKLGIKCSMFSPLTPFVSTHYNYRDHRKILVIDGKVGFNGGVNLGDEYINAIDRFGHWKDTAIRIKGEAVKNLTLMFLCMWAFGEENPEFQKYLDVPYEKYPEQGFAFSYGVNPFDRHRVGEHAYMDIINRAQRYVHIMTPYLILDDELLQALKYAALRGVDVKLILPGVPDKRAVYCLAKTYFDTLIESGVEIYLYTPGFVHAKVFVSDDVKAVVGTINLDYRSLYHHFECATYMYDCSCIPEIENDFLETMSKCSQVALHDYYKGKITDRIIGRVARLFAPLL